MEHHGPCLPSTSLSRAGARKKHCAPVQTCPNHRQGSAGTEPPRSRQGCGAAFTLIELLVVIAIIAILAALMFPALGRAKAAGQRAACHNNFRQLQVGWHLYADENDNVLPLSWDGPEAGLSPEYPSWAAGFVGFLGSGSYLSDATNVLYLVPGLWGSIGPYVRSAKVYHCPADRSRAQIAGHHYDRVRSVSSNYRVGCSASRVEDDIYDAFRFYRKYTDLSVPGPARTFVFIDEHESTIGGPAFNNPWLYAGGKTHWHLSLPASRHSSSSAAISFADGHVEMHRWLDPRTRVAVIKPGPVKGLLGYEPEDPSSPTNPDAQWLFERSTAPNPGAVSWVQP